MKDWFAEKTIQIEPSGLVVFGIPFSGRHSEFMWFDGVLHEYHVEAQNDEFPAAISIQ